jgi:hypothetical protein
MNKIEKSIYNILQYNPYLKQFVRNIYQSFFDLLPRKNEYFFSNFDFKEDYFFGFHDVSPFSYDSTKVLSNKIIDRSLNLLYKSPIEIGYFNFNTSNLKDFIKIDSTFTWNYHKGCRLQWLDDNKLIYNSLLNERKLISKIYDINTGVFSIINYPIDSTSNCGNFATSFSYERLENFMPGYGYQFKDESYIDDKFPNQTGLYLININTNSSQLLLSLYDLVTTSHNFNILKNYYHYITHTQFSFDGKYISFLHRWTSGDYRKRFTNLVIYDICNNKFFNLPTNHMVSHYVWNSDNQILAYCRINDNNCHSLFNIPNVYDYKIILPDFLNSDGHQHFINKKNFITDTYPDKYRMSKLYQVNLINDQVKIIASLYSPKKFQTKNFKNHIACDLHPRVSPCGKFVCFDSPRTDVRSIYIMPMSSN